MKKTRIQDALTNDSEHTEILLKAAYTAYTTARKSAQLWRNEFLENLAQAKADHKGTDAEKELKSLVQIEKKRRQARNIKRMRGKLGIERVTKVYQTDEDGNRKVCESAQKDMNEAFLKENNAHFSQTEGTPPMQTPLADDLEYLAETEMAEQVLNGSYEPTGLVNPYAMELLHELRRPEIIRRRGPIPIQASTQDHIQGWRKTKEKAAEYSGPSMAEVKAASQDKTLAEIDTFM
jgi:hypothetical protein